MASDFQSIRGLRRIPGVDFAPETAVRPAGNQGSHYVETELKSPMKLDLAEIGRKIPNGGSYDSTQDGKPEVTLTFKADDGHQTLMLRCYLNDQGEVYKIGSSRPPYIIASHLLAAMGNAQYEAFKSNIPADSKLSLEYSDSDRQRLEERSQRAASNNRLLENLNRLPQATGSNLRLTPDTTRGVLQAEILEVRATDKQHMLASFGAGPCVIVAAYSPSLGKVVMAHVDGSTNIDTVKSQFDQRMNGAKDIQLHFAGGDNSSRQQSGDLAETFSKDNAYTIKTADIVRSAGSASLAIDAKTGKVSSDVLPDQIDKGKDFDMRMQLVLFRQPNSPLKSVSEKAFRHPEKDRLPVEGQESPAIQR